MLNISEKSIDNILIYSRVIELTNITFLKPYLS